MAELKQRVEAFIKFHDKKRKEGAQPYKRELEAYYIIKRLTEENERLDNGWHEANGSTLHNALKIKDLTEQNEKAIAALRFYAEFEEDSIRIECHKNEDINEPCDIGKVAKATLKALSVEGY